MTRAGHPPNHSPTTADGGRGLAQAGRDGARTVPGVPPGRHRPLPACESAFNGASRMSQSVKGAASVPAASRGFDAGKRVNGRKRHIVVDNLGLLLVVMVTAASATDRESGRRLLARLRERHWLPNSA